MQRIRKLLESPDAVKWIFEGDSITHGALHTFGWRDYTELFSERLRFEMGRHRDVIIKNAASGHTTRDLLSNFDWRVGQFRPQVVFLMFGMNDCSTGRQIPREEFRANLQTICDKIRAMPGAVPVLQTTCPILPGFSPDREPNFDAYMDTIRAVASANQLPLIDHTRHWRDIFAKQGTGYFHYWMSDAFHPNQHGHLVFMELLFREVGIFDEKSFVCRLFRP
jgi:lysophospholipase L1-like esterase